MRRGSALAAALVLAAAPLAGCGGGDPAPTATFTAAEVAEHSTEADCWSIVDGKVYDLTAYVAKHPHGGADIVSMCGIDATGLYDEHHGGKPGPANILKSYLIGTLAQS